MSGIGRHHHIISTKSSEAQRFFDQGLTLVFAFNHEEATRAFQRAAELDPRSPMPFWGIALASGPCINLDIDPPHEKTAYDAVQKAVSLAPGVTESERAYIQALAKRYSADPKIDLRKLDADYAHAMRELSKLYPDDLDAATLYAESLMDLHPWKLWSLNGHPAQDTDEIVAVLESVLRRAPDHIGANHYYIHAVEASLHPERALPSAARLEKLAPAEGHLAHMPAHIYARVGDHFASAHCNEVAIAADKKFLGETQEQGVYRMMYYSHNLHFLAFASCMNGNFAAAKDAAAKLVANVAPGVKAMPDLEGFLPTPIIVLCAFERWADLLKLPAPDASFVTTSAVWRSLRGIALANTGKTAEAEQEQKQFRDLAAKIPQEKMYDQLNKVAAVFKIHENLLAGAIAHSRHDDNAAIDLFKQAIAAEDGLNYSEPPPWYPPVRPTLGRLLLATNHAAEAEKIFREDLDRNPRDARALAGLRDCLNTQGRKYEADQIDQQFHAAWKVAAVTSAAASKR